MIAKARLTNSTRYREDRELEFSVYPRAAAGDDTSHCRSAACDGRCGQLPDRTATSTASTHTGSRPLGNGIRPIALDPFQYRTFIRCRVLRHSVLDHS